MQVTIKYGNGNGIIEWVSKSIGMKISVSGMEISYSIGIEWKYQMQIGMEWKYQMQIAMSNEKSNALCNINQTH